MRFRVIALLSFLFWSCELDYEDNERLLIKGDLNRGSEYAFPKLPIEIFAYNGGGLFRSGMQRLGVGEMEPGGTFNIVALSPKSIASWNILVNEGAQQGYISDYSSLVIRGLNFQDSNDATYVVPEGFINELSNARFEINRVDNMNDSLNYSFRYLNFVQTYDYTMLENIAISTNQIYSSGTILPGQNKEAIALTNLLIRDTLLFEYRLIKSDTLETGETRFVVEAENNNYVFEF